MSIITEIEKPWYNGKSETTGPDCLGSNSTPLLTSCETDLGQVDLCASVSSSQTGE